MKKLSIIFVLLMVGLWAGNAFAQGVPQLSISWSDYNAAILDSITAAKYILSGVDVDQDGKQEFIVPIDYGTLNGVKVSQIAVFEAVDDNDYELAWSYIYPGESDWQLTQPTVGDLDGDGNLEILAIRVQPVTGDPTIPNLYVFECVGDNNYGVAPVVTWDLNDNVRNNIRCVAAADLDNDGKQEVILTARDNPPGVVVASVSDFIVPVWTIEYIDSLSYSSPDMASVAICNLDGDVYKEVALTPLQDANQVDLYLIEYDGVTYQKILPPPKHVFGKGALHALDAADLDADGRDELYIGAVETGLLYVVTKPTGDVTALDTTDLYLIGRVEHPDYQPGTGWLPGGTLGDADGDGKMSFLGSASGTVGCGINDWEYQGGGVTDSLNWVYSYISVDLGWGNDFFIYGIDWAADMDGDGKCEFIVARGNPNIGHTMPVVYVTEDGFVVGIDPGDPSSAAIPKAYNLEQNYPNPFNPTTYITYELPKSSKVTLEIYNILGQRVKTLVNNRVQEMGSHKVIWNTVNDRGQKLATGIYIYRLKANNFIQSKKMILVR